MNYTANMALKANVYPTFRERFDSIKSAFASIADPRRNTKNKLYSIETILLGTIAALFANQNNILAIAQWIAGQSEEIKKELGFIEGRTPNQSTINRLLRKIPSSEVESVLTAYFDPSGSGQIGAVASEWVAMDGKCMKGVRKFAGDYADMNVHLLSLFCAQSRMVLAEMSIEPNNGEVTTAPQLIQKIDWHGRVLTGDAAFCQREICKAVVEAGGEYLFVVKGNQKQLREDVELLFDTSLIPEGLTFDLRKAKTVDKGHGRIEIRKGTVSSELAAVSDWPYLEQVIQIERVWTIKGEKKAEFSYAISSLTTKEADVLNLLDIKRGHWGIESMHWIRDVVFGEDKSLIHMGETAHVMAALRNTSINILRRAGFSDITARRRRYAYNPGEVLRLLGLKS